MLKLKTKTKIKNLLKISIFIATLCFVMTMAFTSSINNEKKIISNELSLQAPPEGYRQLKALQVFEDTDPGGWAGDAIGALETSSSASLPLDWDNTYDGKPSLRVNLQQTTEWWQALITPAGWCTVKLEPYLENGILEFNVKGNVGGEQFTIGVRDKVFERAEESIDQSTLITNYITVTTDWQHVSIPLSDFISEGSGIVLNQILCLVIGPAVYPPEPLTFWVNDIDIISPGNEEGFAPIKVNQVGYIPDGEKYALVSGFVEEFTATEGTSFEVRRANDNSVVFTGVLTLVSEFDEEVSGEMVLRADFSELSDAGEYYIAVSASGIENSPPFQIATDVYDQLLIDSARYFYYQRANEELPANNAPDYPHAQFHLEDFNSPLESGYNNIYKDVSSGWYDAGDFGKYTNAGATAVQDLLWAYELFPSEFYDGQFNIPESGNGIPDILDEIRIELEFILKMQDENSGGFYHRVQSIGDDVSDSQRAIKDIGDSGDSNVRPTPSSADSVGILARGSRFYEGIDSAFADQLLAAAEFGWTYLENNPNYIGIPSGPYGDDSDLDDRLFASACLYQATGDSVYNNYFLSNYEQFADTLDNPECAHFVGDNEIPAYLVYLSAENADSTFINWFTPKFSNWRTTHIDRVNRVAWHNSLEAWQYWWGSNLMILNTPMDIAIGSMILGDYNDEISEIVKANLNYILGVNPMQICMVTGYGTRSTTAVFSNIYSYDNLPGLPKGILPGGANSYDNSMTSNFNAKCYTNTNTDWTSSEHTIYWNSPLVFDIALIAAEAGGPGDTIPPDAPTGLIASAISSSYIELDWNDNSEQDLLRYRIYRSTSSNFIPDDNNYIDSASISSYVDSGLDAETIYYYLITAVDTSFNEGDVSNQANATTLPPDLTPPATPIGLTATTMGSSRIELDWNDNTESDLAGYIIYRSISSGFTPSSSNEIAETTSSQISDTGLSSDTTYYYKVIAVDTSNNPSNPSNEASATTEDIIAQLRAQYRCANTATTTQDIRAQIQVLNDGPLDVALTDVTVRYWFTSEPALSDLTYSCDYAAVGSSEITSTFGTAGDSDYLEIGFTSSATVPTWLGGDGSSNLLPIGANTGDIQNRIGRNSNVDFDQSDDYSFDSSMSDYTDNPQITVYYQGDLVWGTEPSTGPISDPPSINSPANINYEAGDTGNSITWIATDDNPTTYTIILDGTQVDSGSWSSGSQITINVDDLSIGTHIYTCTVTDGDGQTDSDSVTVTVSESSQFQNGDVNHDGTVDIIDALMIAQHYVGLDPQPFYPEEADVDGSGTIDIVDALMVAQAYVGLIELPP